MDQRRIGVLRERHIPAERLPVELIHLDRGLLGAEGGRWRGREAVRVASFHLKGVGGLRADEAPSGAARDALEIRVLAGGDRVQQRPVRLGIHFTVLVVRKPLGEGRGVARHAGFVTVRELRLDGLGALRCGGVGPKL